MNQRIKKLWIKALRSGKYKQGEGYLRRNGDAERFCCLGVLCDLYRKATGEGEWSDRAFCLPDGSFSASVLPVRVIEWAGLSAHTDPMNPRLGRVHNASSLNDNGKTFSEIADRVERYL